MSLSAAEWEALALSLRVSGVATALAFAPALVLAWWLERGGGALRQVVNGVAHLPLVLPPVVVGFALLHLFGGVSWLAWRWSGAALAAALMGFPLLLRSLRLGFAALDRRALEVAELRGDTPFELFTGVTLPLMSGSIFAGLLLCFARALGEFGATITFVGNLPGETRTLPLAIYQAVQTPAGDGVAWRLCLLSVGIGAAALFIGEWLARRSVPR
jgi:molybdate transport system permease protein